MFKSLWEILESGYYSLPAQLLVMQVRYQKYVLACWIFFFLATTNNFGEMLGVPYLFLEPEYLGHISFTSMFLLGCGMGTFVASYMISTYVSDSFRFHFLAIEKRPFLVYFLNNLIIPVGFLAVYSVSFIQFQKYSLGHFEWSILLKLVGMYAGLSSVIAVILLYFSRVNRNFVAIIGERATKTLNPRRVIIAKARAGMSLRTRVDYYLATPTRLASPDPNDPAELRQLVRILNQNHGNALFSGVHFAAPDHGFGPFGGESDLSDSSRRKCFFSFFDLFDARFGNRLLVPEIGAASHDCSWCSFTSPLTTFAFFKTSILPWE
jgi:hypothetical protein